MTEVICTYCGKRVSVEQAVVDGLDETTVFSCQKCTNPEEEIHREGVLIDG